MKNKLYKENNEWIDGWRERERKTELEGEMEGDGGVLRGTEKGRKRQKEVEKGRKRQKEAAAAWDPGKQESFSKPSGVSRGGDGRYFHGYSRDARFL